MRKLSKLLFASSNINKFKEASAILDSFGIDLQFFRCDLEEIQSDSIEEISKYKAKSAFLNCKKPLIVEDDSLEIKSLKNFPGPYSSYVFQTIGNDGILSLVGKNRKASFHSVITYCDSKNLISFNAKTHGSVSYKIIGNGWGYDPIFIPNRYRKTFAQISDKNKISHRYKSLKKFSSWFLDKQELVSQ